MAYVNRLSRHSLSKQIICRYAILGNEANNRSVLVTYLKWWKSCASEEGMKGRWYPECVCVVLNIAIEYHNHTTERWEPMMKPPVKRGIRSVMRCSSGCEYTLMMESGAVHSWCFLWMYL